MARSQQTFSKKEREKKKRKKKQDKMEERARRKQERMERGKVAFEDKLMYVDENGNLSDTPPDPSKKKVIKAEDIPLGVPYVEHEPVNAKRVGTVKFYNTEKGYGFITDDKTRDSIFVHMNGLEEPIRENDKVRFDTEKGPKGPVAINVEVIK